MYLARLYEQNGTSRRIRYAVATIMRDRVSNEGAFKICFEMDDEDLVVQQILMRGLKNSNLRRALESSHLIDLTDWLGRYPDLAELYLAPDSSKFTIATLTREPETGRTGHKKRQ